MSMLSCDIICECYMRVTQRFASVNESPCTRPSELPACSSSRNFIFVTCVCSTSRYTHDNKLSAEAAWAADHTWQVDGRMLSSVTVYYVYIDTWHRCTIVLLLIYWLVDNSLFEVSPEICCLGVSSRYCCYGNHEAGSKPI